MLSEVKGTNSFSYVGICNWIYENGFIAFPNDACTCKPHNVKRHRLEINFGHFILPNRAL